MSFSRYDVYTTVQSIYCYPDSNVLKNKLNIVNSDELKQAEEQFTSIKQYVLLQKPIRGRFTKTHLFRIHRFIFEDIYPFAGRIRRESISKGDTQFYPPDLIEKQLDRLFTRIRQQNMLNETDFQFQLDDLAFIMAELNIIHPFREGNGRTIREFIRCLGLHYGLLINWGNVDKEKILSASIQSVDDSTALRHIIECCIE